MYSTLEIQKIVARNQRRSSLFALLGFFSLCIAVAAFLGLFAQMFIEGINRLNIDFFIHFPSRHAEKSGILSAWVGSACVMAVTAFLALPLGVLSGIYLEEYAKKNFLTSLIEINISNLAGVPSIVYGLLALSVFVYKLNFGQSILSAGCTLALLILPVIIVSTREAIRAIPQHIREGAYGLGATKWQVTKDHIIPYSMPGVLTGIILGMSRAIGETACLVTIGALTYIAFLPDVPIKTEFPYVSFDWLFSGFTVMPIQMFNWTSRPEEAFQQNAAAAGLVLMFMTLTMNAVAIYLRHRLRKNIKW
jgi:phosphate transport system permease protein